MDEELSDIGWAPSQAMHHEGSTRILKFYWKHVVTEITKERARLTSNICSHST